MKENLTNTPNEPTKAPREWICRPLRETFCPQGVLMIGPEVKDGEKVIEISALEKLQRELNEAKKELWVEKMKPLIQPTFEELAQLKKERDEAREALEREIKFFNEEIQQYKARMLRQEAELTQLKKENDESFNVNMGLHFELTTLKAKLKVVMDAINLADDIIMRESVDWPAYTWRKAKEKALAEIGEAE